MKLKKGNSMKKMTFISLLVFTFLLSACNTIHGVGEDLEKASDQVKQKL
jgi:predicted small secreted protein